MSAFVDHTARLGQRTKVWHFAVVLADVVIGDDCSIGSGAEIGRESRIGDNCRIGAHVFLPPKSWLGRSVFVGPGAVFTDDKHPYVCNDTYKAQPPSLGDGCSIGAGAVILPGVKVGEFAMVGAGCVVTHDVPAHSIVYSIQNTCLKQNTKSS